MPRQSGAIPVITIVIVALPFVIRDGYLLHLAIMAAIFSIVTLSLNVAVGFAGQLSLGQAGFWGIGAYTSALCVMAGVPWLAAFILAGLASALVGVIVSIPFLRLKGIYLGMATFGFGEIVHLVLRNWQALTGGSLGLRAIPAPALFGFEFSSQQRYYGLVIAVLAAVMAVCLRLINSASGLAMQALSEDELAAEAAAIDVKRYKVTAIGISCLIAGFAGSLFAHYATYLNPENFTVAESMLILTMVIVGGQRNVLGSVASAALLTLLPEILRVLPDTRMLVYGVLLVSAAVFRPQGLLGALQWGQSPPDLSASDGRRPSAA